MTGVCGAGWQERVKAKNRRSTVGDALRSVRSHRPGPGTGRNASFRDEPGSLPLKAAKARERDVEGGKENRD
jgi:hypothetical protein